MNRRNLIAAAAVTPLAALPVRGDAAAGPGDWWRIRNNFDGTVTFSAPEMVLTPRNMEHLQRELASFSRLIDGDTAGVGAIVSLRYAVFPVVRGQLQTAGVAYDPGARLFAMTVERGWVPYPVHRFSRDNETETIQSLIDYWNNDYLAWAGDDHKTLKVYWRS